MNFDALASMGIGGIIAAIVLYWKRQDDTTHSKEKADWAKTLETMFARMELRDKTNTEVMQALTMALTALQTTVAQLGALKELNDRIADMERRRGGRGA